MQLFFLGFLRAFTILYMLTKSFEDMFLNNLLKYFIFQQKNY